MNHSSRSLANAAPPGPSALPSRYVRHAILDARAGLPVALFLAHAAQKTMVVLPAETASPGGIAAFCGAVAGPPRLVLAASRASALMGHAMDADGPVAFNVPAAWLTPPRLQALADPTRPQPDSLAGIQAAELPMLADAALQLAKLGRLLPAVLMGVAAQGADGQAAQGADGQAAQGADPFAVSAADILAYQAEATATLARVAEAAVPLAGAAEARLIAYRPVDGGVEHVALLIGRPEEAAAPLVRIHSECFTGDVLGSLRCDCGPQLDQAIDRMSAEGAGVLLYMAQEGRGIGLVNKLRAYALQDRGLDTLDANRALGWGADERNFAAAAMMLRDLGILRVRLLTNNPDKVAALQAAGIAVAARLRHAIAANGVNDGYLETKARRFGHLLG